MCAWGETEPFREYFEHEFYIPSYLTAKARDLHTSIKILHAKGLSYKQISSKLRLSIGQLYYATNWDEA